MSHAVMDTMARRAAAQTPRRAVLGLLALAAGSIMVPLTHAETLANWKNKHGKGRAKREGKGCTICDLNVNCSRICCPSKSSAPDCTVICGERDERDTPDLHLCTD